MPQHLAEIEITQRDTGEPLAHGRGTHSGAARRDGHRGSLTHRPHRREDVPHVVGLAGQNVGRQHPLTGAAPPAARQPNRKSRVHGAVLPENLHAALDRTRAKRQVLPAARGTHAAAQSGIARTRQPPRVTRRLYIQYVDQTHVRLRGWLDREVVDRPLFVS
jgi:hypothetical protein